MDSVQAAGTATKCIGCLCSLACCAAQVTFIVYLGIFAFNNPDMEAWYGKQADGEGTLFAQESDATVTGDTELEDIHGKFVLWFMWGFIVSLAPCAAAPIMAIANCIHETVAKVLGGIISCGIGCGGLAWWISGIVWRFKASGSFSSGDSLTAEQLTTEEADADTLYQIKSGNFMLIYYLIVWGLMACSILSSMIGLLVTCCTKSD